MENTTTTNFVGNTVNPTTIGGILDSRPSTSGIGYRPGEGPDQAKPQSSVVVNAPTGVSGSPSTVSPVVQSSKPAEQDYQSKLLSIKSSLDGIKDQANRLTADRAAADQKAAADKSAADSAAIAKQNADANTAKAAAISSAAADDGTATAPASAASTARGTKVSSGNYTFTSNGDGTYAASNSSTGASLGNVQTPNEQSAVSAQLFQAGQQVSDIISGYAKGTIPLTPGEQAQVDSIRDTANAAIAAQQRITQGQIGTEQMWAFRNGSEYSPQSEAAKIASIASEGAEKIRAIATQMAGDAAKMESALRNDDVKAVKDAYDAYSSAAKDRIAVLQKQQDDMSAAAKAAQDRADRLDDNRRQWAQLSETVSNNARTNARQDALAASTIAKNRLDSKKVQAEIDQLGGASGQGIGSVGTNSVGSPSASQQQSYLNRVAATNPGLALQIKAAADYRLDPKVFPTAKGARDSFDAMVRQYDPNYDSANYASRAAYLKSLQSGQYSLAINSANKAVNHMTSLLGTLSALGNGSLGQTLNMAKNSIDSVGNPALQKNLSSAGVEALGVATELEKFFKGTGSADVSGIEEWKNSINTNLTPGQQQGLKEGALNLLTGQLDTLYAQYRQNMGETPGIGTILQPETLTKLSNLGVDVTPYIQGTPMGDVQAIARTGTPAQQGAIRQMLQDGKSYDDILSVLGE